MYLLEGRRFSVAGVSTLKFKRLKAKKPKPKPATGCKKNNASVYDPKPLRAARQHIGTEGLTPELLAVQSKQALK